MARRNFRKRSVSVEASVHLRDQDWTVRGEYTRGSEPYFSPSYGNYLPGDPDDLQDIEIAPDGHDGHLEYDELDREERAEVDEALVLAAEEDAIAAESDEGDRAYDSWRDSQLDRREP